MTRILRNIGDHFFRFGIALTIGTITTTCLAANSVKPALAAKTPVKSSKHKTAGKPSDPKADTRADSKQTDSRAGDQSKAHAGKQTAEKPEPSTDSIWFVQEKVFRTEPAFTWLEQRELAGNKPDDSLMTFMQEQKIPGRIRPPRLITARLQTASELSVARINPYLLKLDTFKLTSIVERYPENYDAEGPGISLGMLNRCPIADGFDFPVGRPHARGYYNAQKFTRNQHLGDDWNGRGGGNTDLNDPIFSIAHGIVVSARREPMNWGNVVRIVHNMGTKTNPVFVESVYAHMRKMLVKKGDRIRRGQKIGTIGNVGGVYYAHLHLEIRNIINKSMGTGYSHNTFGYLDPTRFIRKNRPGLKYAKRYLPKRRQ